LWTSLTTGGAAFSLTRAMRDVVLGMDPPVRLSPRAVSALADIRDDYRTAVHPGGNMITRRGRRPRWWTWGGYRVNATLLASIGDLGDQSQRVDGLFVRLREDLTRDEWRAGIAACEGRLCLPNVDDRAVAGLKFSAALPRRLAEATLAMRVADLDGAANVLREPSRFG
jgi:ATP-dependent Lhr-like helicase